MRWPRAAPLLAIAAAACLQLLAAAVSAQVVVPDTCSWVHWEDYQREQPIVTYDGSSTAYCLDDITTECTQRCKTAIQRVRLGCCGCRQRCVLAPCTPSLGSVSPV